MTYTRNSAKNSHNTALNTDALQQASLAYGRRLASRYAQMKIMARILITFFFILFSVAVAVADDGEPSGNPLEKCREMGSYSSAGACAADVAKNADKELNTAYKTLMDYLQPKEKEKLKDAQRKWIAFRNSDCEFTAPLGKPPYDSKVNSDRAYCIAKKTLVRLHELQQIISWPPGCNGCPF